MTEQRRSPDAARVSLWCRLFGHILGGCTWQVSPSGHKTFYGWCARCGFRSYAEGEFERVLS